MRYENVTKAVFLERPNRFVAKVLVNGEEETVHVKNTGRCKELLIPGCEVWLTEPESKGRKTRYDLIGVRKSTGVIFNIDSQAPNQVVKEWLMGGHMKPYTKVVPEYTFGESRIDFYMEQMLSDGKILPSLMEVKGCTLEQDGIGYFPDAPTMRGVKHLRELIRAKQEGLEAYLAFVIQMDGVEEVRANVKTHREFGEVLEEAKACGVKVLFLCCHVVPEGFDIVKVHVAK